jgi:hypothetical protein
MRALASDKRISDSSWRGVAEIARRAAPRRRSAR